MEALWTMAQDIAEGLGAADYGSQTMLLVMWGQPAHVAYNDTIFIWRMAAGRGSMCLEYLSWSVA